MVEACSVLTVNEAKDECKLVRHLSSLEGFQSRTDLMMQAVCVCFDPHRSRLWTRLRVASVWSWMSCLEGAGFSLATHSIPFSRLTCLLLFDRHALRWDGPSLLDIEAESDSATPSTDGSSSTNNSKSESAPNASVTAGSDPERGESNSVHSLNQSGSASATAAVDLDQDSGAEAVVLGSWTTHSLLGLTSVVVVRSWSV